MLGFVGRRHPEFGDDDSGGPKYLNTGATALFHKGDQLFVADPQRLDDGATPVLVEGPMDAIRRHSAGAGRYVGVAPLGTSLTEQQAAQLGKRSAATRSWPPTPTSQARSLPSATTGC